jgi:2-furoyl-CoA dehydrogenase large subunit
MISNRTAGRPSYSGRAVRRVEDADLLRGRGRFGDDLPVRADTLHAAVLRSPHAHAEILSVDVAGALAVPGVDCVVTSEDARRWTRPFAVAVKTAMEQWCLATDRVRYVGEPVAVVLARNRDTAEDALERIAVEYGPLPPTVDPEAAARLDAPLLHPAVGSNVISDRVFRYGDPETAFAAAEHRISITTSYPRNSATPIECFVVIAEYSPGEQAYNVVANFQARLPCIRSWRWLWASRAIGCGSGRRRIRAAVSASSTRCSPTLCCWRWPPAKPAGRSNGSRAASSISSRRPPRPTA